MKTKWKRSLFQLLLLFLLTQPGWSQIQLTPVVFHDFPDGSTELSIRVSNFDSIVSLQFSLHYDDSELAFEEFTNLNLPALVISSLANPEPGVITVSWLAANVLVGETLPDGHHIFGVKFNKLVPEPGINNIYIDDYPTPIEVSDASGQIIGGFPNPGVEANLFGQVFFDDDLACDPSSPNGLKLADFQVEVNDSLYAVSRSDGSYYMYVQYGTEWKLEVEAPNDLWALCNGSLTIDASDPSTFPIQVNPPMQATADCPDLFVDLSTPFLRRCFSSVYTIRYCNHGTEPVLGATVEVEFDPFLDVLSTSISPSAVDGNHFTFEVGNLGIGACGTFTATVEVSCDALLGQTHCTEASIHPQVQCEDPQGWDGSSLAFEGACGAETVDVTLKNVGSGAMSEDRELWVIQNEVLVSVDPIQLNAGDSLVYHFPADGSTYRLQIDQDAEHPGSSAPSITMEGCTSNGEEISLGFATMFAQDEADSFCSIDCQENVGAYDPNDKKASPKGYLEDHLVEPNGWFDYRIRFQNTGTDTAFTVFILDTLSENLDIATLQVGAASHDYELKILPGNILQFEFRDILLPDSTTNFLASQGFVQFQIYQQPELPDGTVIRNRAAIYFDFNEPVITGEVFHTVMRDFLQPVPVSNLPESLVEVRIQPNPLDDKAVVIVDSFPIGKWMFTLYNAQGQCVYTEMAEGASLEFTRKNLPAGLYFFTVSDRQKLISSGKVLLK